MSQNETLANILAGISTAAKKFPLAAAGAPVDLANIVAGGFANIVDAARGKQITREVAGGLVPKPVGGSEWLYEKFGMTSKSSGLAEDSAAAALSPLSPGGALKSVIIPAAAIIPSSAIKTAEKMLAKKPGDTNFAAQVFENLGTYFSPHDKVARAVVSDANAALRSEQLAENIFGVRIKDRATLEEVLDHDSLYALGLSSRDYAPVGKIKVINDPSKGDGASYYPASDTVFIGGSKTREELTSKLLHETQHGIQTRFGMQQGASPLHFNPKYNEDRTAAGTMVAWQTNLQEKLRKQGVPEDLIKEFVSGKATGANTKLIDLAPFTYEDYRKRRIAAQQALLRADTAFQDYKKVYGEAEARAVQTMFESRLGSTQFPHMIFDVPYKQTTPAPR